MLDLIVIGGGISGLTVGVLAKKRGLSVKLLEADASLGGVISSRSRPEGLMELGPDSLLVDRPAVGRLLSELKLTDSLVFPKPSRPFISRGPALHPLPEGFRLVAPGRWLPFVLSPLLSVPGKLRALADLVLPASDSPDQTLAQLVSRRLGGEVLERLAQPLLGGLYASDPAEMSLTHTMPHLLELERRHGSLIRGMCRAGQLSPPRVASLPGGLGQLTSALRARLGESVETGSAVRSLAFGGRDWTVSMFGRTLRSREVVLALPAPAAAGVVASLDAPLAELLARVPYRRVAVAHFWFAADQVIGLPKGCQGFLIPAVDGTMISAVSLAHQKWPDRILPGFVHLKAHLGGAHREEALEACDSAVLSQVLSQLCSWVEIRGLPRDYCLHRYPTAMPEYRGGHAQLLAAIEGHANRWPGLHMTGNWMSGAGIGECVARAEQLAQRMEVLSCITA